MVACTVCGEKFETERGMRTHRGRSHKDWLKQQIEDRYIGQRMSAREIGEELDMARKTVDEWIRKFDLAGKQPPKFHLEGENLNGPFVGYPRWTNTGTGHRVRVHRLQMIAKGADPDKVFSRKYSVDHINGQPIDNRMENLRLMKNSEHGKKDGHRSSIGHSHKEYLRALVQKPPDWAEELDVDV